MHGISYRGNIPSSFLFTPLSPSSEAEYKTALANSPISQIISNETQLLRRGETASQV